MDHAVGAATTGYTQHYLNRVRLTSPAIDQFNDLFGPLPCRGSGAFDFVSFKCS